MTNKITPEELDELERLEKLSNYGPQESGDFIDFLRNKLPALIAAARRVDELEAENERYRQALQEICCECICHCDIAYTGRGLHESRCLASIGDIANEALEEKD